MPRVNNRAKERKILSKFVPQFHQISLLFFREAVSCLNLANRLLVLTNFRDFCYLGINSLRKFVEFEKLLIFASTNFRNIVKPKYFTGIKFHQFCKVRTDYTPCHIDC